MIDSFQLPNIRLATYTRIWLKLALNAIQEAFVNRATFFLFFFGKMIRFGMSLLFLFLIRSQIDTFASYTTDHLVIFYLTYYFIDLIGQSVFRGVYQFSSKMRTGEFDFYLLKPINPLFQSLAGKPDINDALFFIPSFLIALYVVSQLAITITFTNIIWYLLLCLNGFLILMSLHILVMAIAMFTVDIDGIIWLYRDTSRLSQFPIAIYHQLFQTILYFIVPIGMMVTIPSEVLLGREPSYSVGIAFLVGIIFFYVSRKIWNKSIQYYSSASS